VTTSNSAGGKAICFVDAVGGGLAAIGAAVAQSLGLQALAATTAPPQPVPEEVTTVLREVSMKVPTVTPFDEVDSASSEVVQLGRGTGDEAWALSLYAGRGAEESLERLSAARMVRDRIERRLEARAAS
jgi:hypothetical protein